MAAELSMPDEALPAPESAAAPAESAPASPRKRPPAPPAESGPSVAATADTARLESRAGEEEGSHAPASAGPAAPLPPLRRLVEALLFAADAPLSPTKIKDVVGAELAQVRTALDELATEYETAGLAFGVQAIGGGFVISTRPEFGRWVTALKKSRDEGRLSPAALETLAIIAYRQPVNRVNIEAVRGVQSGSLIRALMDKDLVRVVGKEEVPGHPVLYGTTPRFLEILGLNSLSDLPKPEELK